MGTIMAVQTKCPARVLERLMNEYGTTMLQVCFRYLNDRDLAQDAVQEAFLRIYRCWPQQGPDFEKAWILCITANVCRDQLRSAWQRKVVLIEEYPPLPDAEEEAWEEGELFHAICALKPIYREAILLRYYKGLSLKEISAILGIRTSAVSMRLKRAMAELREMLCMIPSEEW